jgi:hypothetical protein
MGENLNVPGSGSSQPSNEDPHVGSHSGEGGVVATEVSGAHPEFIVPPLKLFIDSVIVFNPGDGSRDISVGSGNLQAGELNKVSDLLEGSSKYLQKCSLNDIMFLVMLIMIKSASEQRESRFEGMVAKKHVSTQASIAVYEMKMAEAKATYEKEKEAAELQKAMAIVSMCCACLSIIAAAAGPLAQAGNAIAKAISMVAGIATSLLNAAATIAQGVISLQLAEQGKDIAFVKAEVARTQTFFESTMKQIRNMQEAYSASQRSITSSLQSMQEILEKQQSTRLSIARNI